MSHSQLGNGSPRTRSAPEIMGAAVRLGSGCGAVASVVAAFLGTRVVFKPKPRFAASVDRCLRADSEDAALDGNTAA